MQNRVFIVNPHAARGAVGKNWPQIRELAEKHLGAFRVFLTTAPGEATTFARLAVSEGAQCVVCVGGDGTLNEVINGLVNAEGRANPDLLLGFLPNGTGCDFRKTLRIPTHPEEALKVIRDGRARSIDLGRLHYVNHSGEAAFRYFHNLTSFGLGGEVDERVNRSGKKLGGFLSFIIATLASLVLYEKKCIRLRVDGHFDEEISVLNVAVANGQYHGGGMWVAPAADPSDGLFHITVIGALSLPEVFYYLPKLYNGKILHVKRVRSLTGKRVEAVSERRVLLDVDGEQPGCLPATIEIVPSALRILGPEARTAQITNGSGTGEAP
jgi:YegS/Rv2252/BmrU family lipid kinase